MNQAIRARFPAATPLTKIAHKAKSSNHRSAKPNYPVRVRGARPSSGHTRVRAGGRKPIRLSGGQEIAGALPAGPTIPGPSFNSRTAHSHCADRGATPRSSANLKDTFMSGHEEDSNPRRSDRRTERQRRREIAWPKGQPEGRAHGKCARQTPRGSTGVPDHHSNSAKA